MDYILLLSIIGLAGLVHSSFQLSVSTLTLMSGHSLGKEQSRSKLNRLMTSFVLGVFTMTSFLLIAFVTFATQALKYGQVPVLYWAGACGFLFGVGICVWLFYFRRNKGTSLWIPRHFAEYLTTRSKKTKRGAEAFGLGVSSVLGEVLFISAPVLAAAFVLTKFDFLSQILYGLAYVLISILFLVMVSVMVSRGHKITTIQKWREKNKYFLQFASGGSLLVLAFYIYVNEVVMNGFFL